MAPDFMHAHSSLLRQCLSQSPSPGQRGCDSISAMQCSTIGQLGYHPGSFMPLMKHENVNMVVVQTSVAFIQHSDSFSNMRVRLLQEVYYIGMFMFSAAKLSECYRKCSLTNGN